ncbi:PDZ domain-containing protein [Xanthomonas sp. LMG 8992]|uniref:PDZ domain-containing protein n=1 Tax=Xanthomonas sp. LMG 8992 TaxID=1591157 RepID=UPI00136F46C2|nr:PDZ domain-containing protein [Xanthomonas sp. LMG 8992]MXV10493.1 PDZ domain-containing protein [Xanthomonas sp. LMG 8992]
MLRNAVYLAVVFFTGLAPVVARAQSPAPSQSGFAFCSVTDTGSVPAKIWVSPVFALSYPADVGSQLQRSNALAGAFLRHVGTLGGAGNKECALAAGREDVQALREQQRALWDKRLFLMKAGSWRDVDWTPSPEDAVAQAPAQRTRYFYCYATQVDIPDRSDRARTVASQVFAMPSGADPMAVYTQSQAYAEAFKQVVGAHGQPEDGTSCTAYDTQGEADKASRDYRKLMGGFNTKFAEVPWRPSEVAPGAPPVTPAVSAPHAAAPAAPRLLGVRIVPVTAELVLAAGLPSPRGAWVVEVFDGIAARAGIKPMDVLLEIAGQPVVGFEDVPRLVAAAAADVPVPVKLWRDRREHVLSVVFPAGVAPVATAPAAQ